MASMTKSATKSKENSAPGPQLPEDESRHVLLEVPVRRTENYAARAVHLDLTLEQSQALRDLFDALMDEGAKLKNGAPVLDHLGALRWLLERVAEA